MKNLLTKKPPVKIIQEVDLNYNKFLTIINCATANPGFAPGFQ